MPLTVTFIYRCSHFFVKITFTFWTKHCLGSSLVEKLLSCSKYSRSLYANFTFIFWTCQYFPWSSFSNIVYFFFTFMISFLKRKTFRGEGLHVFRVDNAEDIQISFDLASKSKLENKKRAGSQGFTSEPFKKRLCVRITLSVSRGSEVSRLLIPFFEFLLPQTLCS